MKNKITIYRGSHQIGGCATEIRTQDHRIIIDLGTNLPSSKKDNVMTNEELIHTVFNGESCDGVLFTHYHGDHMGLYKKIPRDIPLYIGPTAKKILRILTEKIDSIPGTEEKGLSRVQDMKTYRIAQKISAFGDISVTPFLIDHSALDSYMFLIEIDGTRILFTGDFREHGIAGERDALGRMIDKYIGKIDILITEGTMLSRKDGTKKGPIQTEQDLEKRARELFKVNKESVILVSSTNLDSIMGFYHALPWGMDFVCDAYQAKIILAAMEDKGKYYPKYRPEMIHERPRRIYIVGDMEGLGANENCYEADFSILKDKGFTMLARENKLMFAKIMANFPDPLIIYSKWEGYLKGEHADQSVINFIGDHRMEKLHTSGHAYVETIGKLIRLTDPEVIIPMHTECADRFAKIPAFSLYKDRVHVLGDGEPYYF